MKCVAEILAIREYAEAAYKIEQKRLDEEAKEEYAKRIKETIDFCETKINNALVWRAENRFNDISYNLTCVIEKDRLNNKMIIPLECESKHYANGNKSHRPSKTENYDYETFINYLESFCYIVTEEDCYYQRYNSGTQKGVMFKVCIK
jgi:hypothetical protein